MLDSDSDMCLADAMEKLTDFLAKRRKDLAEVLRSLTDQRMELESKILRIQKELSELDAAGKAIGVFSPSNELPLEITRREAPKTTIKEAVVEILEHYPKGLLALDILDKVNQRFGLGIVRTSLSPQLSRLKNDDKKIINEGAIWRLAHQKKEGPAK